MLWKRICLRNLAKKHNSIRRSRIRLGTNDQKNLMLSGMEISSENLGLLGKRKLGHLGDDSNIDRVRKKRKIRENSRVNDENVDRISDLPEPIIHHIFAHLRCTKDVVRTSLLSKKWRSMFNSYLVLDFDERWFRVKGGKGKHNRIKAREVQKKKFKRYVEKSMSSRLDSVPRIDKFRLYLNNTDNKLGTCMTRWILAALEKNVKELSIDLITEHKHFFLPPAMFLSSSITSLKLGGFLLFGFTTIKLSNLRILSIKDSILVNENVFEKFEQSCPLIEDLRLVKCSGLLRLSVSGFLKLRRLEVHECRRLSCIELEAPNLETFWYHAKKDQECKIDLKGSGNVKHLTLKDRKMTDTAFQDCLSKCPFLEKLVLRECTSLERLTILSGKLKSLAVIECVKLQEVNIDAPYLLSFEYSGQTLPFSSLNISRLYEAKFDFGPIMRTPQFIVDYQKYFGHFDRSKGFKLIIYSKKTMMIYEEPKEALRVANYFSSLELTASSRCVQKIVDNWLRECHGRNLTLVSPSRELLKLINTMVMDRGDNLSCCRFYANKCWRHYVEDVRSVSSRTHKTYYDFKWIPKQRND